jgi:hypothetical protein
MNQADNSALSNGAKPNLWIKWRLWATQHQQARQAATCQRCELYFAHLPTLASCGSERLSAPEVLAEQASQRGGLLRIRLEGDHVVLVGHAVTVSSGNLHVYLTR